MTTNGHFPAGRVINMVCWSVKLSSLPLLISRVSLLTQEKKKKGIFLCHFISFTCCSHFSRICLVSHFGPYFWYLLTLSPLLLSLESLNLYLPHSRLPQLFPSRESKLGIYKIFPRKSEGKRSIETPVGRKTKTRN